MTKTMKRYGAVWKSDGERWKTTVYGRFHPSTWKFGGIHQCIIDIEESNINSKFGEVRMCLEVCNSRDEAMKQALAWIERFVNGEQPSAEEFILQKHKDWPDMYRYRYRLLDQLMFVIGGGNDWVNGRLMSCSEDSRRSSSIAVEMHCDDKLHLGLSEEMLELLGDDFKDLPAFMTKEKRIAQLIALQKIVPLEEEDPTKPINFYPISEGYSKVWTVPENVTDDWLLVCAEAIEMLDARNSNERNDGQAVKLREHYTKMFGERYLRMQKQVLNT